MMTFKTCLLFSAMILIQVAKIACDDSTLAGDVSTTAESGPSVTSEEAVTVTDTTSFVSETTLVLTHTTPGIIDKITAEQNLSTETQSRDGSISTATVYVTLSSTSYVTPVKGLPASCSTTKTTKCKKLYPINRLNLQENDKMKQDLKKALKNALKNQRRRKTTTKGVSTSTALSDTTLINSTPQDTDISTTSETETTTSSRSTKKPSRKRRDITPAPGDADDTDIDDVDIKDGDDDAIDLEFTFIGDDPLTDEMVDEAFKDPEVQALLEKYGLTQTKPPDAQPSTRADSMYFHLAFVITIVCLVFVSLFLAVVCYLHIRCRVRELQDDKTPIAMEEGVTVKRYTMVMSSPFTDEELQKGEKKGVQGNPEDINEEPIIATVQSPAMQQPRAPTVVRNGQQSPKNAEDGWIVPLDEHQKAESNVENTRF